MSFILRPATIDDAAALARIHIAGWRASYENLLDETYLAALDEETRIKDWQKWLADGKTQVIIAHDEAGQPAGFISFGPLRTPPPGMSPIRPLYTAEIYGIYILPSFWRQGLGTSLMQAAVTALRAQKHRSLCLWVMEGNKRAIAFYRKKGGQKCGTVKTEIGNQILPEIAFAWRDSATIL